MPKPLQLLLIAAMLAAATSPSAAQRPDKPKGPKDKPAVRVVFQDSDRGVFRDYYRGHLDQVKPLPPGIAKNLERGKPLPPGIARTRVPEVVVARLPWRPAGYTFFLVGDRVVLLDGNGRVADILVSIF
ncbi:MAG TPA: hypothetical protein VIP80_17725 [Gemmatimonadales bacterium]|jgi:hypothetical protein